MKRHLPGVPHDARLGLAAETVVRELTERSVASIDAATPHRLFHPRIARRNFESVRTRASEIPGLQPAYSIKTNPRPEMLACARASGFLAEVISGDEFACARDAGFSCNDIVYNGPCPLDREHAFVAFADSIEALQRYASERRSTLTGIRYRPDGIDSRFGIVRSEVEACSRIARLAESAGVALHVHVRPEDRGARSWTQLADECLQVAVSFARAAAKPLRHIDLGGGWTPAELDDALGGDIPRFVAYARDSVSTLESVIIEPGQSIATPTTSVTTRVLEVRRREAAREAIVDAGYPDLPQARTFPHRVYRASGAGVVALEPGNDRIGGSTCLEYDVLRSGISLDGVRTGDTLWIADAGSYDSSMTFPFARGREYGLTS